VRGAEYIGEGRCERHSPMPRRALLMPCHKLLRSKIKISKAKTLKWKWKLVIRSWARWWCRIKWKFLNVVSLVFHLTLTTHHALSAFLTWRHISGHLGFYHSPLQSFFGFLSFYCRIVIMP
jgi:hypothetical protein